MDGQRDNIFFSKKPFQGKAFLLLFFLFLFFLLPEFLGSSCLFTAVFGIPCAGCGSSRAALLLFQGEIKAAFKMHPLIFLSLAIFIVFPLFSIINFIQKRRGKDIKSLPLSFKAFDLFLIFLAAIYLLVYLIRMLLYFPHTEPMLYNSNSVLSKIINFIRQILSL